MKQYLEEIKRLQRRAGITEATDEQGSKLEIGDRIIVTYGNEYYGHEGEVEDIRGGFVIVSIDDIDGEFSMHSSDVKKLEFGDEWDDGSEEADAFYDDDDYMEEKKEKPGLWANIRAKRERGEAPARKGSKAYKKAVKAAKEINKNK